MTLTEARKYLARAQKNGYVPYHTGIVSMETIKQTRKKKGTEVVKIKINYGINIDGDGTEGRNFGCPIILWDAEKAEEKFPVKKYYLDR